MINEEIRDREVRLIDENGEQLGVVPIDQAQQIAIDKNLDLVKIAPQATPPVCKVMDYGKYRFELAKKEKETRKNQKVISIKEVKMTPSIDTHDFETKMNHAKKFLKDGNKLKVTIPFRGREIKHSSLGLQLLERVSEVLADYGTIEKQPKLEGRNMFMFVSPNEKK